MTLETDIEIYLDKDEFIEAIRDINQSKILRKKDITPVLSIMKFEDSGDYLIRLRINEDTDKLSDYDHIEHNFWIGRLKKDESLIMASVLKSIYESDMKTELDEIKVRKERIEDCEREEARKELESKK